MNDETPEKPEPPDRRINWSIWVLFTAILAIIAGAITPLVRLPDWPRGSPFWLAAVVAGATAIIVNWLRPRYEKATGKWKVFYDW